MAKILPSWLKYGPHLALQIGSSWIIINMPRDVPCKISHCWVYPVVSFLKNGQNRALLFPKHGPSNWFSLNLNHCAKGSSMPNFTLLILSCSPLSLKWPKNGPFMAKTWSSIGPSNWIFLNHNHSAKGCFMPNFTILGISQNVPFMAKTWSSHGLWNWFFLNHNHCAQGCLVPHFTILGVSHSPLS